MRRILIAFLAITLATTPVAADGFYGALSLGAGKVTDELAEYLGNETIRVRMAAGYRWDRMAVEAWVGADTATSYGDRNGNGDYYDSDTLGTYGLDVKFIQPMSRHFSAYGRISASHMTYDDRRLAGRGLGAGAGIQLAGKIPAIGFLWWPLFFLNKGPKVHSAVFFDVSHDFYRLHGPGPTLDAKVDRWMLGFAVGQDF